MQSQTENLCSLFDVEGVGTGDMQDGIDTLKRLGQVAVYEILDFDKLDARPFRGVLLDESLALCQVTDGSLDLVVSLD